jgi:hypothetical protein
VRSVRRRQGISMSACQRVSVAYTNCAQCAQCARWARRCLVPQRDRTRMMRARACEWLRVYEYECVRMNMDAYVYGCVCVPRWATTCPCTVHKHAHEHALTSSSSSSSSYLYSFSRARRHMRVMPFAPCALRHAACAVRSALRRAQGTAVVSCGRA